MSSIQSSHLMLVRLNTNAQTTSRGVAGFELGQADENEGEGLKQRENDPHCEYRCRYRAKELVYSINDLSGMQISWIVNTEFRVTSVMRRSLERVRGGRSNE